MNHFITTKWLSACARLVFVVGQAAETTLTHAYQCLTPLNPGALKTFILALKPSFLYGNMNKIKVLNLWTLKMTSWSSQWPHRAPQWPPGAPNDLLGLQNDHPELYNGLRNLHFHWKYKQNQGFEAPDTQIGLLELTGPQKWPSGPQKWPHGAHWTSKMTFWTSKMTSWSSLDLKNDPWSSKTTSSSSKWNGWAAWAVRRWNIIIYNYI